MSGEIAIVVVAAGRGSRAGAGLPKQYRHLAGRPLLAHTLSALAAAAPGASLQAVIHPDDEALYLAAVEHIEVPLDNLRPPVHGAATRQASVRAGLEALAIAAAPRPELVLIHDGARPFPKASLIAAGIAAGRRYGAAIPAVPICDTIAEVNGEGRIIATPERSVLRAVQTPQVFDFELILAAHRAAAGRELTDDASVAALAGHDVHVFAGEAMNMKVTTEADLMAAEERLAAGLDIRMGQGYDVHAFGEGDHVVLGGVKIAHSQGLVGHSDADVLIHAIADAIYGALAEADIGAHFPPSDPTWKGAASDIFLRHAAGRVHARGGRIAHIDATLVCEAPKLSPHRDVIRTRLAEIAGVSQDRIAVKATTSEGLGFTGRGEGIAALAVATIRLPATR